MTRDPATEAAMVIFEEKTGIRPIGGRKHAGSMREFIQIRIPVTQEVVEFTAQFYRGNRIFRGVPIKFLGSIYSDSKDLRMEIEWGVLTAK